MAARRLKFKPKPLVGLIRRNKEQNNEPVSVTKNDLVEKNDGVNMNGEHDTDSQSGNLHINLDSNISTEVSRDQNNINDISVSQESISTVLDQNINTKNNVIENKINDNTALKVDLKSDINSKIKDVLLNSNDNNCKNSVNSFDNSVIVNDQNIVQNDSCNLVSNCKDIDKNSTNNVILDENISSKEADLPISSELNPPVTFCSTKNITVTSETEKSDKKDIKSNSNQKMLPRFGKVRFKPVLSNNIRKKDVPDVNKNEEILPEQPVVANNTCSLDETTKFVENENISFTNCNVEKSLEKENIDKNILEEPIIQTERETSVIEKTCFDVCEKSVSSKRNDNISTSDVENDAELPVRSPVKLFVPIKRQRSQGTSFSNIKAMQNFKDKFKDGNIDKTKLKMRDLIFYNPTTNPMPERPIMKTKKEFSKQENNNPKSVVDDMLEEEKVDDVDNEETEAVPVPQLKVGPDGKIMIDPKSLVIETTGMQKSRAHLENSEIVQENEFSHTKFHKRKVRRSEWSAEETLLFYKALNDLGADFSLMQSLFPKRTRRDLKLKFKKEERTNLQLIDKAMTSCGNFDFTALENELKKDREERMKKIEEQKRLKEEKKRERREKKATSKPKKKHGQKKSEAMREFDEEDTGIIRVGKKYKDTVNSENSKSITQQKDDDNNKKGASKKKITKNNTRGRKPRKRKRVNDIDIDDEEEEKEAACKNKRKVKGSRNNKKREEDDIDSDGLPEHLFDFRLNVSSDDGIVSDFNDEDNHQIRRNVVNDYDEDDGPDSEIVALNSHMFTKTRSGRQPKSRLLKQDSVDNFARKIKRFKRNNGCENETNETTNNSSDVNIVSNSNKLSTSETSSLTEEEIQQIYKKKFERCYRLFEEPLDLSCANTKDDINNDDTDESNNSFTKDVKRNITVPIVNDINTEIINSAFSSESHLNGISRKVVRGISESLQIMEELTLSEGDCNILNGSNKSNVGSLEECDTFDLSENRNKFIIPDVDNNENVESDINTPFICSSNNDNDIVKNSMYLDNQCPQILVNNLSAETSTSAVLALAHPIQLISHEDLSYIVRQNTDVILQEDIEQNSNEFITHSFDDNMINVSNKETNDDDEMITHSKIHCYPSSDHTYTSLVPKPVERKNTYLILTPVNSVVNTEQSSTSTVIVYPTTCHENVTT